MSLPDAEPAQVAPPRRRRLRFSTLSLIALVAVASVAFLLYRNFVRPYFQRPEFASVYKKTSPIADGSIGPDEYGPPLLITWGEANTLAAFQNDLLDPATKRVVEDPTRSKKSADLSVDVLSAYTNTSLFLAFRVHDQFVDAQEELEHPEWNDGIELFIDGDRVPNDYVVTDFTDGNKEGTKEGFQIGGNAAGQQFTKATDFTSADWKSIAKRTDDGYIIEMEIPLKLIDTADGPPFIPAGPGTIVNLGFAVVDNDQEVHKQSSYAYLRAPGQSMSPYMGGESAWTLAIKLEPRSSLLPW